MTTQAMHPDYKMLRRKTLTIHRRLSKTYGEPRRFAVTQRGDALNELIDCILSQHTNDQNTARASAALRAKFSTWAEVRDAPTHEVIAAIRTAGLANQKGPRIQAVLREITAQRGELDIGFLAEWPVPEAKQWLMALPGVGPKTAAITLLFALNRPAFPVDTHVHRVTRRLGLIPTTLSANKAHDTLEALIPSQHFFSFHVNLIAHGRARCKAQRPLCERCPLVDVCDHVMTQLSKIKSPMQSKGDS